MMTNLFSTFDPMTSMNTSINWLSSLICMMFIPQMFWIIPSRMYYIYNNINIYLNKEFKLLILNSKGLTLMPISLFSLILMNNYLGLLPYIFTSSSHMVFSLSLSLTLWITLILYGWINKVTMMFAHTIPLGTPPLLMPFMVVIETISNIIRPGSLAVRLTANMIAGHLLMSLLGNNNMFNIMIILVIISQIILMMFETAVTIIQAYVFSILSVLYSSEVI
uniref:ATP synthase subunit a n=1 Tax=Pachyphlegyas modiglianii TaxID=2816051 RepID=A0A8T9ZWJ2_9HEMI|nr:ATPase subunit 6 [Pachyphlegyas modiglianii]